MKKLPDAEFEIMDVIWRLNKDVTSTDVFNEIAPSKWKIQTIIVFLKRLEGKGYISSEKRGKERYYSALIVKEDYLSMETKLFLDRFYKKNLPLFMASLLSHSDLSSADIAEIEKKIIDYKNKQNK